MRRQTILLAAALAVATPAAAITNNRSDARTLTQATHDPAAPTARDRLILKLKDAKAGASSIAPTDEASLLDGLAEAHKLPKAAPDAALARPAGPVSIAPLKARPRGANFASPDAAGFTPHIGMAPVHEFSEFDGARVSLNVGPVVTSNYHDVDLRDTLRADGDIAGADVAGMAVGLSFKLN